MNNFSEEISFYLSNRHKLESFKSSIIAYFLNHPKLNSDNLPIIHSVKSRLKDPEHLREKLQRKLIQGREIDSTSLFYEITDLAGIRILHLYQDQFHEIHKAIMENISEGEWALYEDPKAYTWDPETKSMYDALEIRSEIKESYYTSVHYVIKPNNTNPNPFFCEIQVRTLFEEIWGEVDHSINYPNPTSSFACKEQLRVLSKLISAGTRLTDSIYRTHQNFYEYEQSKPKNT